MRTKYTIYPNINSIFFFLNIIKFKTTKYLSSIEELSVGLDSVLRAMSAFFPVFRTLFTGPTSTKKNKKTKQNKTKRSNKSVFHGTIYIFKNYFTTVFSAINFQFSVISGIQVNP